MYVPFLLDLASRVNVLSALRYNSTPSLSMHTVSASASTMKATAPRVLILGAPASGKGTQCKLIAAEYGVKHVSTGDMLRVAVAGASPLGVKAKDYMDSVKLVPDQLVTEMLFARLSESNCTQNGWLLDGFPRRGLQWIF